MKARKSFLLILEDSELLSTLLVGWFEDRFPKKKVAHLATVAAAMEFIREVRTDLFLVDLNLPDGNGLDFIREARGRIPEAHFVVMTNPVSAARARGEIDALGPITFFEKPLDLVALERVLRVEIDGHENPLPEAGSGFSAAIRNTDPVSILQLKCMAHATTVVEFLNPDGDVGQVALVNGEIVGAEAGGQIGIHALAHLLAWKDGAARELPYIATGAPDQFRMGWQKALMEGVRMADENATVPRI